MHSPRKSWLADFGKKSSPGKLRVAVQKFRKKPRCPEIRPVPNGHQALARHGRKLKLASALRVPFKRCTVRVTLGGHARPADTIRGLNNKPRPHPERRGALVRRFGSWRRAASRAEEKGDREWRWGKSVGTSL
jgi:hypothetical protein